MPITMTMQKTIALAALAAMILAGPARACAPGEQLPLKDADKGRLERLEASRTKGLAQALLGEADDRQVISTILGQGTQAPETVAPGDYACRTVKLGGISPAIAYADFACTIAAGKDGLAIVKTSGSQRFSGSLEPGPDGFVYRGALHYADEAPIPYGTDAERDQVGCLTRSVSTGQLLLELPEPRFESEYDVIVLTARP